jgi:hypothetical protein
MKIVHIDELPVQSRQPRGREGKSVKTSIIMQGDSSRRDNFNFRILYDEVGDIYSPRHHHNFCQFYYMLDGDYDFGQTGHAKQGWLVYVPEGAFYGPQSGTPHTRIAVQFGGPSGSGFLDARQHTQAFEELKQLGVFEKGIFKRNADVPGQRTQDSYEAIWEHVNKRKLVYPKPRYGEAILMKPDNFEWEPSAAERGVSKKQLCAFSERNLQLSVLKVEPGARGAVPSRVGIQVGFVLQGAGAANGEPLRRHSAFSGREEFVLTSDEGMEVLIVGLPVFAENETRETLVAAE